MPGSLFREDGVWLRCQLHAHTTNSDGEASPTSLCDHYAEAGFDVLAITDHWHVTAVDHDRLIVLPSSELTADAPSAHGEAEVLALGVSELPEVREAFPDIEALAAWIVEHGGTPFLCHPYWSGLRVEPSCRDAPARTRPIRPSALLSTSGSIAVRDTPR